MCSAWNIFLMRNFFSGVPKELSESAYIDGANDFTILFRIVLPVSVPGIATISLFYALGYWNQWYNAMLYIESTAKYPLQYFLQRIINQANIALLIQQGVTINVQDLPSESIKMATAVVATGPIVLVYPFVQKYFVSGLTVGAVKG
jgi:putative aldouronate transport system permease protein